MYTKVYNKDLGMMNALKIEKNNDIIDESLKNEIQNLKELNFFNIHNIPIYYDNGVCCGGNLYLEMELLEGDLKGFIKTNQINKDELYDIIFELLYTLYEFRLISFEHRDIKTANVAYIINHKPRVYDLDKETIVDNIIHPILIDFNHSGFTSNRNKTLFRLTGINYVYQDLRKLLKVFNQLIKITNLKLFINNLRLKDNYSAQFLYDNLIKLKGI